jgi:aquaporin Z
MLRTLREHWPEYLMEAWGLGAFLVSAGLVVSLLEHPASAVHALLPDADLRRALIGLAMGLTAVAIIYSPWGQRSGAQINPARTFASAVPSGIWTHAWVYFTAPVLGMLAAVELYRRVLRRDTHPMCAKLDHPDHVRCIHCGYEPPTPAPQPEGTRPS